LKTIKGYVSSRSDHLFL